MTTVLAYDPSSTVGGWAVAIDDAPHHIGVWRPLKKSDKPMDRLVQWDAYCGLLMANYQPDIVTIEIIRVSTSHDTTRSLSRFESVFIVRAVAAGAEVIEYQVGQARAAYFGEGTGTMSKEQAYAAMRARYPQLPWLEQDDGGMDQADALVPALAYREIKARKVVIAEEKKAKAKRKREKRLQQPG